MGFIDVFGQRSYPKRPKIRFLTRGPIPNKGPNHALEKVLPNETPCMFGLAPWLRGSNMDYPFTVSQFTIKTLVVVPIITSFFSRIPKQTQRLGCHGLCGRSGWRQVTLAGQQRIARVVQRTRSRRSAQVPSVHGPSDILIPR